MTGDLIRVILADDHAIGRAGLKAVLGGARDISVVGEASNGPEAIALAEQFHPDVVVMDLSTGEMGGIQAAKALAAKGPTPRVLLLTMHAEEDYLVPLLEAGTSGYLVKSAVDRELVDAVRAVARGDLNVPPTAARILANGIQKKDEHADVRARFEELTDCEQDVLRLIAQGYTTPEIGEKLNISPKTVDTHKQRVNEKVGLTHRADYVAFALKVGLLQADSAPTRPAGPTH